MAHSAQRRTRMSSLCVLVSLLATLWWPSPAASVGARPAALVTPSGAAAYAASVEPGDPSPQHPSDPYQALLGPVSPDRASLPASGSEATIILDTDAAEARFEGTPLGLRASAPPSTPIRVHATILPREAVSALSPAGLVFQVDFSVPTGDGASWGAPSNKAPVPLELTIDYNQLDLQYGASFEERLVLYRGTGCGLTADSAIGNTSQYICTGMEVLATQNDLATGTLIVDVHGNSSADVSARTIELPYSSYVYLPQVMAAGETEGATAAASPGPTFYILGSGAAGPQGDFGATPYSLMTAAEVDLFTGSASTRYAIPVPPSAAGPVPTVELSYSSGGVDGMHTHINNQPGTVGLGWSLEFGAMTRSLRKCTVGPSAGDLCLTANRDDYTLTLNGVGGKLVKESGNVYRLQSDPRWKVEMLTDAPAGHPDSQGEYWWVTAPDGTRYRFGGELQPETDEDQDSAFYVPIYETDVAYCGNESYDMCDKVYQWNLDRIEDTNGNVVSYFYEQEDNYYQAQGYVNPAKIRRYVRAGSLERIEYTTRAGEESAPHARVLLNSEMRCTDPTTPGGCDWPSDFPDTPGDLTCGTSGCYQYSPTFWSQTRLSEIQTQVYEDGYWRTVALYDLAQSFPETPPADATQAASGVKLWLDSVTQRPGGEYTWTAYGQLEAEDYQDASGLVAADTTDIGRGGMVDQVDSGDFVLFDRVDFGDGAATLLLRMATSQNSGSIVFRLDGPSGDVIATVSVTSTGGSNTWQTRQVNVSGATGIHDLYMGFSGGSADLVHLNWLRFVPSSALPGLPAAQFSYYTDPNATAVQKRNEMLPNRRNWVAGVSPMYMPRLKRIDNELGGRVLYTYGTPDLCPVSPGTNIRMPYDCFPMWDAYNQYPGWVYWRKHVVTSQESYDSFSGNPSQELTFTYGTPMWHWYYDPGAPAWMNHWTEFRGHAVVTVTDGSGAYTEYRFYRGMDGDATSTAGTGYYNATITLSDSSTRTDHNWLRGQVAEVRRFSAQDELLSRTVYEYREASTAGSGVYGAYWTGVEQLDVTLYGTETVTSRTTYQYDEYGNVTYEQQHGDIADGEDDRSVQREYVYNTADGILNRVSTETLWPGIQGGQATCASYTSTDVPKTISSSGTPEVNSTLSVGTSGEIADVNVVGLTGTHTWINDLGFRLYSPENTEVTLMYRVCERQDNFALGFDDEASSAYSSIPCPPTGGGTYQPMSPLSAYDGEEQAGTWRLKVNDYSNYDGGSLQGWGIRICNPPPTVDLSEALARTEYAYDWGEVGDAPTLGNLTAVVAFGALSPTVSYTSTVEYDAWGRPTVMIDANGHPITTTYHTTYGYADSVTNALGHTASQVVDPGNGAPVSFTDPNDLTVDYAYDEYGRLTSVVLPTEAGGNYASYVFDYDATARPARVYSAQLQDAATGQYLEDWDFFDGFGRIVQTQRPSTEAGYRSVSSQQYDELGRVALASAAYQIAGAAGSGYVSPSWGSLDSYRRYSYDALGHMVFDETLSQGSVLHSSAADYDAYRQVATDANSNETERFVDPFGQLRQVLEIEGASVYTTTYTYDLRGNLTEVTDALANVTTMDYDLLGRKVAMDDPDMGAWTYAYDPVGNLVAQEDAKGQGLYLEYDAVNRLVSKRADASNGPLVAEYEYDLTYLGQQDLTRAYESTGITVTVETEVLARDERYRPTEQGWTVAVDGAYRMAYGYDAADHITTLQYPGGNSGTLGEVVAQSYDLLGRLDGVESATYGTSYVSGTAYTPTGQVAEQTLGNGAGAVARSYSYETGTLRLLGLTSAVTTTIQSLAYTYDDVGNVLSVTDAVNAGQVQTFGYDDLDRLTAAATDAAGVGQYDHDYGYDAIGNITALDGITYTYGVGQPHAVTGVGNDSYQYDDNGNMTVRAVGGITYTLTYDRENRLTGVTGPSTSATFLYDAAGNRVLATVDGQMKAYVGGVYEHTGTGASTSSYAGSVIRRSGYANENGVFTVLGDHLGSTSVLVDATGAVVAQQYYYPYGANRGVAQSDLTERRYTGQYHETGLAGAEGLYYYNARWYDPALGRFVQADTLVPAPGNPQSLNRYSYVLNNPMLYTDPSGRTVESALALVSIYRGDIVDIAGAYGIDPLLLAGVVFSENRNDYNWIRGQDWTSSLTLGLFGGPEAKNVLAALGRRNPSLGITEVSLAVAAMMDNPDLVPANYGELSKEERDALHSEIAGSLSPEQRSLYIGELSDPRSSIDYAARFLVFLSEYRDYAADIALQLTDYNRGLSAATEPSEYGKRFQQYEAKIAGALRGEYRAVPVCIGREGCGRYYLQLGATSMPR